MQFWLIMLLPICLFLLVSLRRLGKIASITMLLIISLSSVGLYAYFGHFELAKRWQKDYVKSYQLRQEFVAMGSIDQIIAKMQQKLVDKPNDSKGWYLLGKLYQTQHRDEEALHAFSKAEEYLNS